VKHAFNSKARKDHDLDGADNRFDRRIHKFANSAYRSAKQHGFTSGCDVIDSVETDEEFINSLDITSHVAIAELGKR
jgi:hypothetical protein